MKRFLFVLLAVVVIFTSAIPKQVAKADGLTLSMVASAAYAVASGSGLGFSMSVPSGETAEQYLSNKINSWLQGRSLVEAFGSELVRLQVGKLLIPSKMVNAIVQFWNSYKTEENIPENSSTGVIVSRGSLDGFNVGPYAGDGQNNTSPYLDSMRSLTNDPLVDVVSDSGYCVTFTSRNGSSTRFTSWALYKDGVLVAQSNTGNYELYSGWSGFKWGFTVSSSGSLYCTIGSFYSNNTWCYLNNVRISPVPSGFEASSITATIPGAYSPPESLNDLQSWEGTVANAPDTNLDQLLEDIFDQSASGTLDVTGEVVDTPAEPVPTAAPTAAPGTIDDVIGQLGEMSGTLEGVQEGVGEAVGQLEGINEGVGSISEALEVPTTSEAPAFKFDLTTLFPFCIPFDIYRFVTMFSASPVAPHVQIPFNIPAVGLQYTFDLDFSSFDSVASVLRSVELIAFCVGLAILTSKVIRW